jgi:hypothetical protein
MLPIEKLLLQIEENSKAENPWRASKFFLWQELAAKSKGTMGELLVSYELEALGIEVAPMGHQQSIDLHDVTNNIKIEVKTSFAKREKGICIRDLFLWQHIQVDKPWDIIALIGINPELEDLSRARRGWREELEAVNILYIGRKDMEDIIANGYLTSQSGGKGSTNDDATISNQWFRYIEYGKNHKNYLDVCKNNS